jgi:hypothetical protein
MGKDVGDDARRTDLAAKRRKRRKDLEDGGEAGSKEQAAGGVRREACSVEGGGWRVEGRATGGDREGSGTETTDSILNIEHSISNFQGNG